MNRIAEAAALAENQPAATFSALRDLVQETVGARLFTVMEVDRERGVAFRSYSSMPDAYPVSGEKPLTRNRWSGIVIERQQVFVANDIGEIADVFPDHELIRSLGCESCLNIPVVIGGAVLGTLNCLDVAGHYTPRRIEAAETLRSAGALAILIAERTRNKGAEHG